MCSQNAKEGDKGNFNWEQGSMLFKVLKSFSARQKITYFTFFKKSSRVIPPHLSDLPVFIC